MNRKRVAASLVIAAAVAFAAPSAEARGWTYTGPHGATITHWGPGPRYWGRPCCYAGVVAGLAAGAALGVAAATRPVVPPPAVYAAPPVIYAAPVVYAPGIYYYAP